MKMIATLAAGALLGALAVYLWEVAELTHKPRRRRSAIDAIHEAGL